MIEKDKAKELIAEILDGEAPPWRPVPSKKVSAILGVSLQSLANWRVRSTGPEPEPPKRGRGNRTFYAPAKIASWLSGLVGTPMEPWKVSVKWLKSRGLELSETNETSYAEFIAMIDQEKIL